MLDQKRLAEIERRAKHYIQDKTILTKQKVEDVEFFLPNACDSLESARCLFDVSTKNNYIGYEHLKGSLWVINASYYSMFYNARALLAHSGVKLKSDLSIHALAFDALVYFFYLTGKLKKELVHSYAEAKSNAAELLGQQKADELIQNYLYEKEKRAAFTYEIGTFAMQSKAQTSLERASVFNAEIRMIITPRSPSL